MFAALPLYNTTGARALFAGGFSPAIFALSPPDKLQRLRQWAAASSSLLLSAIAKSPKKDEAVTKP
jgi:hypothetical protein